MRVQSRHSWRTRGPAAHGSSASTCRPPGKHRVVPAHARPSPLYRCGMTARELRPCRTPVDIEGNIKRYLGDRNPTARYTSFDYCFNYFQSFQERAEVAAIVADDNRQLSCLQLGFYLASWGMLRGSTDLLQRSVKHLVPLVE